MSDPPSGTRLAVPSPFRRVAHAPAACLGFLVKSGSLSDRFGARKIARMFAAKQRGRSRESWRPRVLPGCSNQSVTSLIRTTLTRQKFGSYSASLESEVDSTTARRDPDRLARRTPVCCASNQDDRVNGGVNAHSEERSPRMGLQSLRALWRSAQASGNPLFAKRWPQRDLHPRRWGGGFCRPATCPSRCERKRGRRDVSDPGSNFELRLVGGPGAVAHVPPTWRPVH